jgi:hypothetical protein
MKKFEYLPILKWKLGERGAVEDIGPLCKAVITPLAEIDSIPWDWENDEPSKSLDDHIQKLPSQTAQAWGTTDPIFVDGYDVDDQLASGVHSLTWLFDELRSCGVEAVPVVRDDSSSAYLAAARGIVASDRRGACLRISKDVIFGSDPLAGISRLRTALGVAASTVDLVVDLRSVQEDHVLPYATALRIIWPVLAAGGPWRSMTIASGAFPESLAGVPTGTTYITRADWNLWSLLSILNPCPVFGDYGVSSPDMIEVDPRTMQVSAGIRYTTDTDWMILRGRSVRRHPQRWGQTRELCATLIASGHYAGRSFSCGDEYIHACANGGNSGNATTWRRVGTNHHLEHVVAVLASPGVDASIP